MADPLVESWASAFRLPVTELTPASDFFELGGDSVTAVAIAAEVKRHRGIDMPLTVFFEHGTLGEMQAWLAAEPVA
ncbi:acyl carrier protein [Cellulomonas sp. Sa3CUA2]|uniref:Acyl carrier protein n=1 Tax=Cellulomonas avistercoris TaxID=2762242 RepID=A0ABR8Q9E6_9CELL|nr:acyl carrier protein [Cellulomonas avistercoris]MBD7917058.1 acyl carrier protein [Cellulomonas avistercoris]